MSKSAEKKLAECLLQRKTVLVVFESVEAFVKNYKAETDECQIPIRIEALDRVYPDFQDIQAEIEKYDDEKKFDEHLQERASFETRFCKAKGFLLSKRSADTNQSLLNISRTANQPTATSGFHLRLPKIDLDGVEFRHNRPKFHRSELYHLSRATFPLPMSSIFQDVHPPATRAGLPEATMLELFPLWTPWSEL